MKSLDLGNNALREKTGTELAEIFKAIPIGVTSLDLSANSLGYKTGPELLAQAFKAIPDGVTSLNLSANYLGFKTDTELTQAFKLISAGVTSLNLSNNSFDNKIGDKLAVIFNALPSHVKSVTRDSGTIDIAEFKAKQELLAKQKLQAQQEKVLANLASQLLIIKNKAGELKTRGCNNAYDAANSLYNTLNELKDEYSDKAIAYTTLKRESMRAIVTAETELKQHRGWKEVLSNVVLCILGLGVFYAAYCAYKGDFFRFKTDSVTKLDELQNSMDATSPNP